MLKIVALSERGVVQDKVSLISYVSRSLDLKSSGKVQSSIFVLDPAL